MPPAKKRSPRGQTVFFGRETAVRREDVSKLLPSVEATPEEEEEGEEAEEDGYQAVVSDLLDKESSVEDEGFSTPPEDNAVDPKRPGSSSTTGQESSSKPPPPKRRRRAKQDSTTKPRRSTRITTAEEKVPRKVITAKKTGRGRPPKKPRTSEARSSPESQREWEVERIVDSQVDAATQEHFYRVKWKGFPAKDNTWEPKKNLDHCLQAIRDYEKGSKKKS